MTTTERPLIRDYLVIGLLLLNLGMTGYLVFRPTSSDGKEKSEESKIDISDAEANRLADEIVKIYNAKDSSALYAQFDSLAKAQLTREQLGAQMDRLYPVLGTIRESAFSNAVLAGNDNGRDFYTLNYKVGLADGPFSSGDMKLTVTRRDEGLYLYGFG